MKVNFASIIDSSKAFLSKNSPEIITGIGIAGMITSVVLAVKATPKAVVIIEDTKKDNDKESLTALETVKCTWKCYIPTVITCASSAVCIIKASSINAKRNAALIAAYKIAETSLDEFKSKVAENIGIEKVHDIKNQIMNDKIKRDEHKIENITIENDGDVLCYDSLSGRYFKSNPDKIKSAINDLNRYMNVSSDMSVSLNEYYEALGLKETKLGDELGWCLKFGLIDVDPLGACVTEDGKLCVSINHNVLPRADYYKYC